MKRSSNLFDARVAQAPGIFMLVCPLKTYLALSPTFSLNLRLTSLFYEYPGTKFNERALPLIVFLASS